MDTSKITFDEALGVLQSRFDLFRTGQLAIKEEEKKEIQAVKERFAKKLENYNCAHKNVQDVKTLLGSALNHRPTIIPVDHIKHILIRPKTQDRMDKVLAYIKDHNGYYAEVVKRNTIGASGWNYTIDALKNAGKIRTEGVKRSTKYFVV